MSAFEMRSRLATRVRPALLTVGMLLAFATPAAAALELHPLFADNAVLRMRSPILIAGTSDSSDPVTVELAGRKATAAVKDGRWQAELADLGYGGPHILTVGQGETHVERKNILIGEVWLCGGQSNMWWPLSDSANSKAAIAEAKNDRIRLFTVAKQKEGVVRPLGKWQMCTPETAAGFSAVAYHFGKALEKARGVPIGLISSNWGGTRIERWISAPAIAASPSLVAMPKPQGASDLYDTMIAPLMPFRVRGVLWYQGESNVGDAFAYRDALPALINDWRRTFDDPELAFCVVQLAPIGKPSATPEEHKRAEIRESQLRAVQRIFRAAMVVTTDLGFEKEHPPRKAEVGERLALCARGLAYAEKIPYSGPIYESMQVDGSRVVLRFLSADDGLQALGGGPLSGFTVAGKDRIFHPAQAAIEGRSVVVSSPEVPHPIAVRYGWAGFPQVNLANAAGLLASPFRTDAFRLLTQDQIEQPEPKSIQAPKSAKR